jgi:hypothetical protein
MEASRLHVPHIHPARDHRRPQEPDERRLIAEYEDALTTALAETELTRASLAFDRADRLQQRLLRLTRTRAMRRSHM